MAKKTIDIADAFKERDTLTKEALVTYIHSIDSGATDDSIRQRISRYKRMGHIVSIRRGVYTLSHKPVYKPSPDKFITKLSNLFSSEYPEINYCVWSSAWLSDFTVHQPSQYFYIFETETDMVETAFNLFKDKGFKAFLHPDEQTIQLYVMGQNNPVLIRQLISRAPLVNYKKIKFPSLEKILVDAYSDKKTFYYIQGKELQNIFKFSFIKYSINLSSLLNYAKRRGNDKEISNFINKNFSNSSTILFK